MGGKMSLQTKCTGGDGLGACYSGTVRVISNEPFAADTWKITLAAPDFAPLVAPGQFAMLRLPEAADPLLGRPFAVYDADPDSGRVALIYLVVGKMTKRLTHVAAGDTLELTGPLGNGWSVIERGKGAISGGAISGGAISNSSISDGTLPFDRLVMVAGGVGQTPFYLLAKKYAALKNGPVLTLLYGARSRKRLVPLDDFARLGVEIRVATEDGSAGERGYVTDFIAGVVSEKTTIAACGPRPMLSAVFAAAQKCGAPCFTSLESAMCCGLGICYGCVVAYRADDGTLDYRRTCHDGPVFDAYRLYW